MDNYLLLATDLNNNAYVLISGTGYNNKAIFKFDTNLNFLKQFKRLNAGGGLFTSIEA